MTAEQIAVLLSRSAAGTLATVNPDGSPYAAPVHFVASGGKVLIHCGYHGRKFDNIRRDGRVCLAVWEMFGLRSDGGEPCRTGTNYESVIITGTASVIEDLDRKRSALREFAVKYAPDKDAGDIPDEAVKKTCVIEIESSEITGKRKGDKR
jgi:nitroimidazol reductase NimA-like FMN-containing flavoprotein (pyridoxamine 5'-phosphate oxidase superfamily)